MEVEFTHMLIRTFKVENVPEEKAEVWGKYQQIEQATT